jgi:hypothetical protein
MAWVQVGPHKINTTQICYVDQQGDTVRIYFNGRWEGNPLELHFDEAKSFWRHIKAEDAMLARDKGSAAVLPRLKSAAMSLGVHTDEEADSAPHKPKSHAPSHAASSSGHSHSGSKSSSHGSAAASSHSSHSRHGESHKRH